MLGFFFFEVALWWRVQQGVTCDFTVIAVSLAPFGCIWQPSTATQFSRRMTLNVFSSLLRAMLLSRVCAVVSQHTSLAQGGGGIPA